MTDQKAVLIHRGRVTDKYVVEFWVPENPSGVMCMSVEWEPRMPKKLTKKLYRAYVQERHKYLAKLSERIGGEVVCLDL